VTASRIRAGVERTFAVIGVLFVAYHGAFRLDRLTSGSMQPTLQGRSLTDGDHVLSETITGRWRTPRRYDVVAFQTDEGLQVMKRVIGRPGETIALRQGKFVVDGRELERPKDVPARTYYAYGNLANGGAVRCGNGYYVLGDDSIDSQDSRFDGPIAPERIVGRAWAIVWPPSRMGLVR
jgi:signal peptidase I